MAVALALGARQLGSAWPNPAIGCVLTRNGAAVGRGWTQSGGRPHAETEALNRAGAAAKGATAYVTLEPCSHHGQTPPCAQALIDAGIERCVFAMQDPDPRVSGKGAARLRAAGIAVTEGVLAQDATAANEGFILRVTSGRPLVTWKTASSLDGRIAVADGTSKWITGETARAHAHLLRARHDAVLVGAGTVKEDRPQLNCRLPGLAARSPVRIILDSSLQLPPLDAFPYSRTWVICGEDVNRVRAARQRDHGVTVIPVPTGSVGVSMCAVLAALADRGITRLLVEGGGKVAASLLRSGFVDRIEWFRAARVIGGDGVPAAAPFGAKSVVDAPGFRRISVHRLGEDLLERYVRSP